MPSPLIRDPTTQLPADFSAGFIVPAGYIDGTKMVWNSATSISVTSGAMYIQSLGYAVSFPSTLTLSGLSLTASTWYHLYGYLNSGTPAIELVTTAPAAAYSGTARSKTGDTSRRYLGSALTDSSGNLVAFLHSANTVRYVNPNSNTVLLNGGSATSVNISCSSYVPITAVAVDLRFQNNVTTSGSGGFVATGGQTASGSNAVLYVGPAVTGSTADVYGPAPLGSSQNLSYIATGVPSLYLFVNTYTYER